MATTSIKNLLQRLGVLPTHAGVCFGPHEWSSAKAPHRWTSLNPSNGESLGEVLLADRDDYEALVPKVQAAFLRWREVPAPKRGQLVRDLGNALRANLETLGTLVSVEMGKILPEGIGEVQEMIDICDFAVGLSRQLCGNTMHSERPGHRMYEQWHPLGPIGIISAFNFPVAVWAWNAALAAVCGDTMIWKPSLQTPLVSIAVQKICNQVMSDHGVTGVFNLIIGPNDSVAEAMVADTRLPLISFTGSTEVGRQVAATVGQRLGRSLLELGGNNALMVQPDADLDLAVRAIVFGAIGTAGQRCTTTRRLLVQRSVLDSVCRRLVNAYQQFAPGDPTAAGTLLGPLVDKHAVEKFEAAVQQAVAEGGQVLVGGRRYSRIGNYVEPTIILMPSQTAIVRRETFAPILYVMAYDELGDAISMQNDVAHGLSSAMFTTNLLSAEAFLSVAGSDCGIANINIGTSGAEIGGAFGGEKDTGGGRESGSDAWKIYMRRQTNTINWSKQLPLAQGIQFG
ncbi:MAG: aldehyde dehydrogenase family protein [Planctomycetaceae bacterium]|nr:aldehyde dehydrogenase family protein [Planctomycetaceae bacterium]